MKIFLDTADTNAIAERMKTGLVDGVTTNPSLIKKSGRDPYDVYAELIELGVPDISMEVVGDEDQMFDESLNLVDKFGSYATIKLPCTKDGLAVCSKLKAWSYCRQADDMTLPHIRTNVTLVFTIAQAIMASKAGATYVSPFVGRVDDQGFAGLEVVRGIADMYRIQGRDTKVLSASIRSVQRAVRSFYNGAQIVTMPVDVYDKMLYSMFTDKGLEIFDRDWKEAMGT